MTERFRNEFYYIERLNGSPVAIYPDGTAGRLKEKGVEVGEISAGRRPDRNRVVKKTERRLVRTALFDSPSDYLTAYKKKLAKEVPKYQNYGGNDTSWSLEDMPDDVIATFENWKKSIDIPNLDEFREIAKSIIASEEAAQQEEVDCPDCNSIGSQYACHSCGYARAYYKYPLVRLISEDSYQDVPFDVARFVATDEEALTFEVRTRFDYQGKMAAEQVAVLRPDKTSGSYLGLPQNAFHIEEADALNTEVVITTDSWHEEGFIKEQPKKLTTKSPIGLIEELQLQAATRIVREQTDAPRYQEMYVEFMEKMRKLGKGATVVVFNGHYCGMGESEVQLLVSETTDEPLALQRIWSSIDVNRLIEDVMPALDKSKKVSDMFEHIYAEFRKKYNIDSDTDEGTVL